MKRALLLSIGIGVSLIASLADQPWASATETATPPVSIQVRSGNVTLDYVNAEVSDVIRALAAQSKINVAMNPSVRGQITIHLRNKPVNDALAVVTNLAGLGFKKVNDTYVIASRAEMRATMERLGVKRNVQVQHLTAQAAADLASNAFPDVTARVQGTSVSLTGAPEDLDGAETLIRQNDANAPDNVRVTERVAVKNRSAAQIVATLAKMAKDVTAEAAGNSIVLSGTRADIAFAKTSIELMDVENKSDIETRVYRIKYSSAGDLINMLKDSAPDVQVVPGPDSYTPATISFAPLTGNFVGGASGGASGGTSGGSTSGATAGAGSASAGQATGAQSAAGLSKRALSVLLRGPRSALDDAVRVLSLVDVAPRQMLVEARVIDASPEFTRNLGVEWSWNPFNFVERPGTSGPGPLGFGSFGRVPFTPTAILNAMQTNKSAKLLASPQIAVLNDQDASIFIGDTLRFQSLAQSSPTTGNQFTVVEVPVGIILLVHPRVNEDGNITLRVHPVVSTVTGFVAGLPQTSAREAETVVRVKDGDTIVIGGLIRDEDIHQMSKVPLLGDLPLIGYLFRNDLHHKRRSEVTVFLTIKLIG